MTNAAHTPGPWEQHRSSVLIPIAPYEWAEAYGGTEANARLIAAAPAMLEALQDCRRALEVANFTQELAVVDAAIAAATGAAAMKEQA